MQDTTIEQPEKKSFFKSIPIIAVIGLVVGAIGGYIYYAKVGCVSGTCAITSNPWMSTAWGGAFGYLVFDMFKNKKKKNIKQSDVSE
jgi:xanthine/uracil permease